MSVALSRYPTFIFLALALLCSSLPAHASPFLATLDDFHPNCDIRQLNLSADQHAALRRLRTDFKQINDKAYRKWKSNTASIICSIRANASSGCLHVYADG